MSIYINFMVADYELDSSEAERMLLTMFTNSTKHSNYIRNGTVTIF